MVWRPTKAVCYCHRTSFFAFYFGLFTSKEITLVRYAKVQYYFQIPYKLGEMPPYFEVKKMQGCRKWGCAEIGCNFVA